MAFAPLILRSNITINTVDVGVQVMALTFLGSRDMIRIPATFGSRSSVAGGDDTYTAKLDFMQDVNALAISQILWEALADAVGTIIIAGTFRAGAVSVTNPRWTGTAQVGGFELGGAVNQLGVDSQTFELRGRPVRTILP